jgi:hypothetical protein
MWQINRERHSELIKISQDEQLVKTPKARRGLFKESLFVSAGDLVASFRLRLKARQESIPQ